MELIQDFTFPTASSRIKYSKDGQYIIAAGVYPPIIKIFSTYDLSLKTQRNLDSETINFEILSEDFSKLAILRSDKTIEFQSKIGTYYKAKIPNFGRDISYHYSTCDLFIVGASPQIHRLNLEQGRYLRPLESSSSFINCSTINPASGIIAVGGSEGNLEFWDPRDRSHLASLKIEHPDIKYSLTNENTSKKSGITALKFSKDGLTIATGMASGHCLLYDIRSKIPFQVKDHQFDTPIVDIQFHEESRNIISSCKKIIRIWDKNTGKSFCNVEPSWDINSICSINETGIIMIAGENPRMNIYYVPDLGSAPKWCSFLDSITEELEADTSQHIYQDYKFVKRDEINRLGVERLIGTPYLRAYMHGFFIDLRLYNKIKEIARPDEYNEFIQNKIKEQMEKKRASRISAKPSGKSSRKINQKFLNEISQKNLNVAANVVSDPRFSRMFTDSNMLVDNMSEAYKRIRPHLKFDEKLADEFENVQNESDQNLSSEPEDKPNVDSLGFSEDEKIQHKKKNKGIHSDRISTKPNSNLKEPKIKFMEAVGQDTGPFKSSNEEDTKRKKLMSFSNRLKLNDSETTDAKIPIVGPLSYTYNYTNEKEMDKRMSKELRREKNKSRRSMKVIPKRLQNHAK